MDYSLLPDESITEVNENIRLIQKKEGLTFGTDAYLLAAFIRPETSVTAAELGSGTGIVSLLCASRKKFAHIDCYEIQKEFADIGERNILLNGMENVINQYNSDIRSLPSDKNEFYGTVFANPPYMKSNNGKACHSSMKNIARHEESGGIYEFASTASKMLKYGGKFYCVYRPDRLCDLTDALRMNKLEPKRMLFVYPDTETEPSMVLTEAKKGASSGITVMPPLVVYNSPAGVTPRVTTDAVNRIYENCQI